MANLLSEGVGRLRQAFLDRGNQNVGLLAEYRNPGELLHAVEGLRRRGYNRLDTFTPFPIHGMDRAMGLGASKLGYLVLGGGLTGFGLATLMIWWMTGVDYAINVSNKPLFAWESSIPVMFEVTILFSALGAVAGMLALNSLPKPYNPLFYSDRFARASDDGFFLHVQARDAQFAQAKTAGDLFEEGALAVEYVDHDAAREVGRDGAFVEAAPAVGPAAGPDGITVTVNDAPGQAPPPRA